MTVRKVLGLGIGLGVASFGLCLLITLIVFRSQIFNLSFLLLDTRCESKKIERVLQTFSKTGHFPESIEPDLKLYVTAICSYYGKSSFTHDQTFIPLDKVEALKSLRLLIKNYPRSFVIDRAVFALIVYSDIWWMLERTPNILLELECDKETFEMEYESQLSIANVCGAGLSSSAGSSFMNGDYKSAFHYFRRQGFSVGAIYCYEYGIGTEPLPKMLIWVLKGIGWLLGDFDSYEYWLFESEYNSILKEEKKKSRSK